MEAIASLREKSASWKEQTRGVADVDESAAPDVTATSAWLRRNLDCRGGLSCTWALGQSTGEAGGFIAEAAPDRPYQPQGAEFYFSTARFGAVAAACAASSWCRPKRENSVRQISGERVQPSICTGARVPILRELSSVSHNLGGKKPRGKAPSAWRARTVSFRASLSTVTGAKASR